MPKTIKEDVILIGTILIFIIGFFFVKNITGFAVVEFDVDENLELNNSHFIISYGNNSEERNVEVVNGKAVVDLSNLNYEGNVLVGLFLNGSIIETKEVYINNLIQEENIIIEENITNETIDENLTGEESITNQTQEIIENVTIEENMIIQENITQEENITEITNEINITTESITMPVIQENITRLSLSKRFGKDIRPYLKDYLTNKIGDVSISNIKDINSKNFDVENNLVAVEIEKDGKKITWITTDKKIREIIK